MYRILIVEDDPVISSLLCEGLKKWGYDARCAQDLRDVTGQFIREQPHLALLDVTLPFFDGYYWCGEIRKVSRAPIVFLSSHSQNMDIVMAMNMGGDDYLVKPFAMEVAVAKLGAVLRRAYSYYGEIPVLEHGGLTLNLSDASAYFGGTRMELTKNEFRILKSLMEKKNAVLSREEIMKALWDSDSFIDDNTLTVNVNRLRKKLSDLGLDEFIVTKKGLGYMVHD